MLNEVINMSKIILKRLWKKHAEMESLLGQLDKKFGTSKSSKTGKLIKKRKSGSQKLV